MKIIRQWLSTIKPDTFFHDVGQLLVGTLGARAIGILALPLLSRLYSPADFGTLAAYAAIVSVLAVVACMRLEIAIPIVKGDAEAANVLFFALASSFVFSSLILIVAAAFSGSLTALIGAGFEPLHLMFVPAGIFLASSFSAIQYWATRKRRFRAIAQARVFQTGAGSLVALAFGAIGIAPIGLLLGNMVNRGLGGARLLVDMFRLDRTALQKVRFASVVSVPKKLSRFPKYSVADALLNTAGLQLPILFIATVSSSEAGQFFLAFQLMVLPLTMIGSSIAQVYLARAPEEYRLGNLADYTVTIVKRLMWIGLGPLIVAAVAAPSIMPIVLGNNWVRAGEITSWMAPWMFVQFISSPVSMVLHVTGNQRMMFHLAALGFLLRVGPTYAVLIFSGEAALVEVFSISSLIYYAFVLGFVMWSINVHPRHFRQFPALHLIGYCIFSGLFGWVLLKAGGWVIFICCN